MKHCLFVYWVKRQHSEFLLGSSEMVFFYRRHPPKLKKKRSDYCNASMEKMQIPHLLAAALVVFYAHHQNHNINENHNINDYDDDDAELTQRWREWAAGVR